MELFFEVISGFLNAEEGKVGKVVIFVGWDFSDFALAFDVLEDLFAVFKVFLGVLDLAFFELDFTPLS